MGGIKKAKAKQAIQAYKDWVASINSYLETIPGEVKNNIESSVGYSSEMMKFVENTKTTVSDELTKKINKTVEVLEKSISDVEKASEAQTTEFSGKKINFEIEK